MDFFDAKAPFLPEILALHGKWRAQDVAASCGDTQLNWQQLTNGAHQFAHGLIHRGINTGETLGVVMSNGIPMLTTLLGAMAAGVVSVPINLSVNDDALVGMLTDAKVRALAVTQDQAQRINALRERLPASLKLLLCDEKTADWTSFAELTKDQPISLPNVDIQPDLPLNIIYSSGTTGLPKGIVHNHAGRRDWAYDLAIALRYHGKSRTLLTLGLYSNISWVAMLTTLLAGGSVVIHKHFDALAFLDTVKREQITHTAMVPIQFQRIVEAIEQTPDDINLSSMQSMMSCGSPLHAEVKRALFKHFDCGIIELYGLTEGVITTIDPEQSEGRWSSVGKPLLGTDILILDDDDQPAAVNQSGEVVSRGRITMPGYLNREDANRDASYTAPDGGVWLRTGDIGYLDDAGFLYIVDRKKDMILSGGQNIYPQDIEAVLFQHPAVNDVAVIAAASRKWGETPVALVVRSADTEDDAATIMSWANQKLGKQQRIADVIFIDELPRNPNGKILKRELRVHYAQNEYH